MTGLYFEDLHLGATAEITATLDDAAVRAFADVTGDANPIHIDEAYAKKSRFRRRIAHGAHVASLLSAVMGTRLPGPGAIYISQSVTFLKPVRVGDSVRAVVEIADLNGEDNRVLLSCGCFVGARKVLQGEAVLRVEKRPQAA